MVVTEAAIKAVIKLTTARIEQRFCLSCWSSWSWSSRDMIQVLSGSDIIVAVPGGVRAWGTKKHTVSPGLQKKSQPEKTRQSTKIWLKMGTSILARAIRRASWSWAAKMRRPINIAVVIMAVHIVPDIILTEQKQDAFLTHILPYFRYKKGIIP